MAEDLDQDPLTYGISGPNAYFFTVTSATGEVKLASPLDYEVKGSSLGGAVRGKGRRGGLWSQCPGGDALPVLPLGAGVHHMPVLSAHCRRNSCYSSRSL